MTTDEFQNVATRFQLVFFVNKTDVERLFSIVGDIITNERNRLLPATAEMLLFLRENLPRINFKY